MLPLLRFQPETQSINERFLAPLSHKIFVQVSELIREYSREEVTVWGNGSSTVVSKLYRVVRILSALYETKLRIFNDLKRNGNSRVLSFPFLAPFYASMMRTFQ